MTRLRVAGIFVGGVLAGMILLIGLVWAMGRTASVLVGDGHGPVVQARPLKQQAGGAASRKSRSADRTGTSRGTESTRIRRAVPPIDEPHSSTPDADYAEGQPYATDDLVGDDSDDGGCSDNYSGCVPAGEYDVDCGEISDTDIDVLGVDEYALDRDGDGIACESY